MSLATASFVACGGDDGDGGFNDVDGGEDGGDETGGRGGAGGSGGAGKGGAGGSSGASGSGGVTDDGGLDATMEGGGPDGEAGDSGVGETGADADAGPPPAMLRLIHAASSAAAVDIYLEGATTPLIEGLAYGEATDFLELEAGTYVFDIRAAGEASTTDPLYTTAAIIAEEGSTYSAIAAGDIASTEEDDSFRVLVLEEGFGGDAADTARIRLVHASFDAPAVGIDLNNDDATTPEVADFDRFEDTDAAGIEVPSDSNLQVGIVASDEVVTAFTTPELTEGDDLLVIATGELGKLPREDGAFSLLVVGPDSSTMFIEQNPRVYLVHASRDANAVDVFSGDTEVSDNVAFGTMAPVQLPPGTYMLDFFGGTAGATERPAGNPLDSLSTTALAAGEQYLRVLIGSPGNASFQFLAAREVFDLSDTENARLRAIHAADAPSIDIAKVTVPGTLDEDILWALGTREITPAAGSNVAPGTFILGAADIGETSTDHEFDVTTTAGQRSFVIAAGSYVGGGVGETFRLFIIDTTVVPWTMTTLTPN